MFNMLITDIPTIVNCIKHTINDEREKICIKINGFIFVISLFYFCMTVLFYTSSKNTKKKVYIFYDRNTCKYIFESIFWLYVEDDVEKLNFMLSNFSTFLVNVEKN